MRKLLCRILRHRFVKFADGYKRKCERCQREEWLMSNTYPGIGEPKYYWKHMDFDSLFVRWRKKLW